MVCVELYAEKITKVPFSAYGEATGTDDKYRDTLSDAEEELRRMEEFQKAQTEREKKNDANAVSQKVFKVI